MPAPKVQISIQGGGAKFANLLPAVDAALEVDGAGIVKISRVSGSSAGAIAAALIAARADFSRIDDVLSDPKTQSLIEGLNTKLSPLLAPDKPARYFKRARKWKILAPLKIFKIFRRKTRDQFLLLRAVFRGQAIQDQQSLRSLLEHLFTELCGHVPTTFENLRQETGIYLRVTSSDILGQEGRVIQEGSVIQALLDSCALPFFYRNYPDLLSNPNIDGGICDNLPIQHLVDRKSEFGEIFAFCLEPKKMVGASYPMPTSIFSYAWAIWSAVANDTIKRTKAMLNSQHIVDLETDIALTDFVGAMNRVRERERYDSIKDKVVTKFVDYAKLQSFGETSEKVTISGHLDADAMMSAIFGVYKKHFQNDDIEVIRSSFIVRADSLDMFSGGKSRRADQVTREVVIKLSNDTNNRLHCLRSFIDTDSSGAYTSTRWTVEFVKSKRTVKPIIIPADDPDVDLGSAIDCLLFFDEPLVGNHDDGFHIRVSSHYAKPGAMLPLERRGSDFIAATNGHNVVAQNIDIVLCAPKQLGAIAVARDPKMATVDKGGQITDPALLDEYRHFQSADYNVFVFNAKDIGPGEKVAARFTRLD